MTVLARATVVLDGDAARLHATFHAAESAMESLGKKMSEVGHHLTESLTLPIVGLAVASVKTAADFDESMRKIAALTEVPAAQVNAWREEVRQLAIEYGKTANEGADALFFITSAGVKGQEAMDALKYSLIGSAIGLGETKSVADAATSAMIAYAKSGLTAAHATEIVAAGVKYGKFEASQLAPELGSLTGIASALNISFSDVVATLAVFSRTGTSASEGATQLSAIMSTLLGTSQQGEKMLAEAGLSLKQLRDIVAQPGGLIQVMRLLDTAFAGQTDKLNTIIPNIRALRGVMNALAQNSHEVDNVFRGVTDSAGSLEKALAEVEGPSHDMKKAWAQIKDALIDVGDVIMPIIVPAIKSFGTWVKSLADKFEHLNPYYRDLIVHTAGWLAVLGPTLIAVGNFSRILGYLKLSVVVTGVVGLQSAFVGLIKVIGNLWWISGIPGAFAAASAAGTGLTGVLWGLGVALRAMLVAAAPFLVGGIVVAGIVYLIVKHMQYKAQIEAATEAIKAQKKAADAAWAAIDPASAAARVQAFDDRIKELNAQLVETRTKALDAARAQTFAADMTATKATPAVKANQAALMQQSVQLEDTIHEMQRHRDIVAEIAKVYAKANPVIKPPPPHENPAVWAAAAAEAMKKFADGVRQAKDMEALLGAQFDEDEARIEVYKAAVESLVEAGVPFDAVVGKNGETLRQLSAALANMKVNVDAAKKAEDAFDDAIKDATSAVEASSTPQQTYLKTLGNLHVALIAGKISFEEFERAVLHAQKVLDDADKSAHKLSEAMKDIAGRAVDDFVDMAFGMKKSFHDFVRQALIDITKLIVKIQLMRWLFPEDGGGFGGWLSRLPGFATGGYLGAGELGIVGERGPELVMAGRRGMQVAPMPAGAARLAGGGQPVMLKAEVNVNAIDARGVKAFFEENEGLVAGAFFKAYNKSTTLHRRLGG